MPFRTRILAGILLLLVVGYGATFGSDGAALILPETSTPAALADHGKVYTKADNLLYWQDGAGVEHIVTATPGGIQTRSWNFRSGAAATDNWVGGFYTFGGAAWTMAAPQNHGTANIAYACHPFLVFGAGSSDTVVTVSGTSINDSGTRTAGDSDTISCVTTACSLNDYREVKKFIGTVTFTKSAGTSVNANYGCAKYWDNANHDFTIKGLEVTGYGGANDTDPLIDLYHHKATGWTYNVAAAPTPPTQIARWTTDYTGGGEDQIASGEPFAWKRTNLSTAIAGGDSEGILFRVQVNNINTIRHATLAIDYQ